jgi:membrane protease YdiL (CAAX protease family)
MNFDKQNFTARTLVLVLLLLIGVLLISGLSALIIKTSGLPSANMDLLELVLNNPDLAKWLLFLQHFILFLTVPLVFLWIFYKKGMLLELGTRRPEVRDVLLFFVFLMFVYPVMGLVTFWLSLLDLPEWMNSMDKSQEETLMTLLKMENGYEFFINLLLLALVPGVGEELLFRGVIQRELFQKTKKIHLSILISSLLFSALHFQALGFPAKLGISLVLGYSYYFSGTIWIPMILHMVNNGSATFAVFFSQDELLNAQNQEIQMSWSQVLAAVTFLFIAVFYYFYLEQYYKNKSNG